MPESLSDAPMAIRGDRSGFAARPAVLYAKARQAILGGAWRSGVETFEAAAATGAASSPRDQLLYEIARIRAADTQAAIAGLEASLIREAEGEAAVRRYLVTPFHRAARLPELAAALEKLLEAYPELIDARRFLANTLARLERWDGAVSQIDIAAAASPDDLSLQAGRVQFRLMGRQTAAAAEIARDLWPKLAPGSREAHIVLAALLRGGDAKDAAEIAKGLDPARFPNPHVAAMATEALLRADMSREAIAMGETAIATGQDSPMLRAHIGEAILRSGRPQEVASSAVEHLRVSAEQSPDHARTNALYGEALLRAGRYEEAVAPLERAASGDTKSPKTRLLYARALRYAGRYAECADQYLEALSHTPDRLPTLRQAVGALVQAGRREEASNLFGQMVKKRSAALAPTFEAAFADLENRIDALHVPQARLDWAWKLRRGQDDVDRASWERRAKWGLLADLLIIDWLECREQQAEEAMELLADLGPAEESLAPLRGRGFVIATAHIGPLFSGPILLELVGLPSRWVASTPSIADAHYAASVISTSDQTEPQIVKACLKAINSGYAVGIAADGSGKIGSPTVRFEGQDISYSSFAARAAHRAKVPSLFYAPRWKDGRIDCRFEPLPSPEPDEEAGPFANRWRDAFLACLRNYLGGDPENLRLAGGLWSGIRGES
jgi:tetratricopeptide (TPR) repeat protein